jgi:hypothetical protein
MDPIEDILRFHRPLSERAFKEEVRRLRELGRDPNWLYVPIPFDQREPWRGDVLPFAELPFVNAEGAVEVNEGPAMVLSTTCDAVPGQDPSAVLAPVYRIAEFLNALPEEKQQSQLDALKSNTYARYLYLPAAGSIPESYVNFSESAAVSTSYLARLCEQADLRQRLRFSRLGWYLFNYKLGYYYARVEDEREVPRTAFVL